MKPGFPERAATRAIAREPRRAGHLPLLTIRPPQWVDQRSVSGQLRPSDHTKPISIVADEIAAIVDTAAGNAAIVVQAGGGAIASLRGLTIDMRGTADNGIGFVSGRALHVQNCVIRKADTGINFQPASGTPELYVADTVIGKSTSNPGILRSTERKRRRQRHARPRPGRKQFELGIVFFGITTTGSINATVRDSVSTGNTGAGIFASR